MITGHFPWDIASPSDRWFTDYLIDPRSIAKDMNMSDAASKLIQKIFCLDMLQRIDIQGIRAELEKIDTFFRDEEVNELSIASAGLDTLESVPETVMARESEVKLKMPSSVPGARTKQEKYRGMAVKGHWNLEMIPYMMRNRGVGLIR
jgi:hypothetical protein